MREGRKRKELEINREGKEKLKNNWTGRREGGRKGRGEEGRIKGHGKGPTATAF